METVISKMSKEFISLVKFFILLNVYFTLNRNCFVKGRINFNISFNDLLACKEYRIDSGYVYRDFFLIEDLQNDKAVEEEILHLKFYVLTTKDAHILLSETDYPKKDDKVYEIVIGAGGNTFSTIRPQIGKGRLAIITKSEILSPIDPTPIEVCQYKDGRLDVIIPGHMNPYMTYMDPLPMHIKYISFTTFGSTPAKWFYDCRMDDEADHIIEEKRVKTPRQTLLTDLYESYNYYVPPEGLKFVYFSFQVHGINYDWKTSILITRIELKLKWNDSRVQWDPINYGNITILGEFDFWTPTLVIANGAEETHEDFSPEFMKISHYNGTMEMIAFEALIDTWCSMSSDDKNSSVSDWPNDYLKCSIEMGLHRSDLTLVHDGTPAINKRLRITELSEWHLKNVSVESSTKKNLFPKSNKDHEILLNTMDSSNVDVIIRFGLKRNLKFYNSLFVTPLVASSITLLASFLFKDSKRGSVNLLAFLVATMGLLMLVRYVPRTKSTKIVNSYKIVMYSSCIAYILHVLNLWFKNYPPTQKPADFIIDIINCSWLRFVLGIQYVDSADYLDIQRHPWREIALILNRIFFIILAFISLWIYIKGH